MDFIDIKQQYNVARKEERDKIPKYFKKKSGFILEQPAARQGSKKYRSKSRLLNEYDLSNWQWVCIKRNEVHFFISLQPFDRDPDTGNLHVLMDRIGIYAYAGAYSSVYAQNKMMITNIELPLNDEKLSELEQILIELSECEIYRMQAQYEKVKDKFNLV